MTKLILPLLLILCGPLSADEKELPKDFKSLKALAEKGDARAQTKLGVAYHIGKGVLEDEKEAAKWYRRAAEQGNADAQYSLGRMYVNGEGVLEDYKEAVKWWRKAAEQGYALAQWHLAGMYLVGAGVPKDHVTVWAWLNIAQANAHAAAKKHRIDVDAKKRKALIAKEMTVEQIAEAMELSKEMIAKNPKLIKKKE